MKIFTTLSPGSLRFDSKILGGILTSSSLVGGPSQGAFPGSANVPASTPLSVEQRENKFPESARIAYSRRIRRMTLQRFLISMVAHEVEKVSFQDVLTMYDNLLWCQERAGADPQFQRKFGQNLSKLTELLKGTRFHPSSFKTTLNGLSIKVRAELKDFIYPRRNLPGIEKHVKGLYQVLPHKEAGTPRKQLPQPRRIGVGYRDKGHRRDPAWDGSPSWQEVAQSNLP